MSTTSTRSSRKTRFGPFELDSRAGELRRDGRVVRLQEQTLRLLNLLLERPGEVVLREDIRRRLWPNDTVVEVSHGINAAVQRLREALEESAENPRYIETVARRGYRFKGESSTAATDLAGRTIGRFRVVEKLGGGGMGLVYRAEDQRLGREVALKLLPPELVSDRTAISRFDREARAASAVNHPHICTIYGVEDHAGQPIIVMEYVPGPTLEAVLSDGPPPPDRVFAWSLQIAGALEAAHRKGIVHRDLKPANLVIGESGVKILDFGLATIHTPGLNTITREGSVVGTPDYMSPEQIRGESVDSRSDIFSFGVLLYEMLTGRRPGQSGTLSLPTPLGEVAHRCLQPRPDDRWQTATDLRTAVEAAGNPTPSGAVPARFSRRRWMGIAAGSTGAAVFAWTVADGLLRREPTRSELRFPGGEMSRLSLSPDGKRLAFVANGRFYVQPIDGREARALDSVRGVGTAFWSPDGKKLAIPANGQLRIVDLVNGAATVIADINTNIGGSWTPDGSILIGLVGDGVYRIAPSGGPLQRVTAPDPALGEVRHLLPQPLPDGRRFLFTAGAKDPGASVAFVASLESSERRKILPVESGLVFVRATPGSVDGHLVFGRSGSLVAQRFDGRNLSATGAPRVIADGVVSRAAVGSALQLLDFSASANTIAFRQTGRDAVIVVRNWKEAGAPPDAA
jgi:serine/threonine protein kinase